jgi:hypothetical protein
MEVHISILVLYSEREVGIQRNEEIKVCYEGSKKV